MKKILLFAVSLWAMSFLPAQNSIFTIPLVTTQSIVREYKDNVFIVYNSNGTGRTVNYVDLSAMLTVTAQLPAVDIADFEIYGGSVYFCGDAYGTPIAGLFDITDVFFSGGGIRYIQFTNTYRCNKYVGETDNVLGLRKIEVMPVNASNPHLVMIADASCTYIPGAINRCIVDLYFDGSNWASAVAQAHDGIMYYDDLAVTDNYVVCVAHKHGAEGEYVVPFLRPNASVDLFTYNTIAYPILNIIYHLAGGIWSYSPVTDEEFLIRHTSGDNFATVCHATYFDNVGRHEGTVLNLYDQNISVQRRYFIPDYSTKYPELKYNKLTNSLMLLPGPASTCPNSYFEYGLDISMHAVTSIYKHNNNHLPGASLISLDAAPLTLYYGHGQACLSGDPGGMLQIWRHSPATQARCSESVNVAIKQINKDGGNNGIMYEYSLDIQPKYDYYPVIDVCAIEIKCNK